MDAHAPFHVRVVRCMRSPLFLSTAAPHPRCVISPSTFPAGPTPIPAAAGDFTYTGTGICSCWMCHWHRRPEVHRAAVRTALRSGAHAWNGSDVKAAFEWGAFGGVTATS
jgi:hypothetical protein